VAIKICVQNADNMEGIGDGIKVEIKVEEAANDHQPSNAGPVQQDNEETG
jgi:hypothetical protein